MSGRAIRKLGIRHKIVLIICLSIFIIILLGVSLMYFLEVKIITSGIGTNYQEIAESLAASVSQHVKGEVEDILTYAARSVWINTVKEANAKYGQEDETAIKKHMYEMDKKWISSSDNDPFLDPYIGNMISSSMKDILSIRKNIAEIFITDKFGALVASSNRTSDFYQADEEWWQRAYNSGKGSLYIGNVEFDQSSKRWSVPIAAALRDKDGSIVGICKESLDTERLFGDVINYKIGKTGRAALTDEDCNILSRKDTAPIETKFCDKIFLEKLLKEGKKFYVFDRRHGRNGKTFVSFSKIDLPELSSNNIAWFVFVEQSSSEVFEPLHRMVKDLLTITVLLVLCSLPIGYMFSSIFIKPINNLNKITERIMNGDWNVDIDIKTGDEIEQFADTFKNMILNLKDKTSKLEAAKEKLENFTNSLEEKVKERTKELTESQDATLNIMEDLMESKNSLEEALKVKSEFTSTVSHELRTPLAAIKEGIAIVSDGTAGGLNNEQKEFLDIAKRNVDRLARLINNILGFQKLEAGKATFSFEHEDVNEAVKEAVSTMASLADQKGLYLKFEPAKELPKIKFDRDKISQVLTNLISNAIKFTDNGGVIIKTDKGDNFVKVSVADTGPGIKKEDIPKLFRQFSQLEDGIKRKTGGTGLGLAISKEIIEKHKGKIWVDCEYGKGSTFSFSLPIIERRA